MQDLAEIGRVLQAAGIPWAVLKGPVLSAVIFDVPGVRDYTDVDVLVSPTDVGRVVDVLIGAGAEIMPVDWGHINSARTAELGLRLRHGTVLDLHWNLVNLGRTRDAYRLPTDELLARGVERDLDGVAVRTLDDLDLVLHVLLHACLSGCSSLRWLLDAQQCVRWLAPRHTPRSLADRARELGLTAPARAVLDSVVEHLDPEVAPWARAMGRPTAWTRLLGVLSRRRPPSMPSVSANSNKTWYAATRPTTLGSVLALARTGLLSLRYSRSGWPEPAPLAYREGDPGYAEWLGVARREAR